MYGTKLNLTKERVHKCERGVKRAWQDTPSLLLIVAQLPGCDQYADDSRTWLLGEGYW